MPVRTMEVGFVKGGDTCNKLLESNILRTSRLPVVTCW